MAESSSSSEDGDSNWKAAINSISSTTNHYVTSITTNISTKLHSNRDFHHDLSSESKPKTPKLYTIRAQKLLEDLVEKSLVFEKIDNLDEDDDQVETKLGIRLFKNSTLGMVELVDEIQEPRKRPRIIPVEEVDEKSKMFKRHIKSVVVEGVDIMGAARDTCQKILARAEAKEAAAKAAIKRDEERVAKLKKTRGEKWLPAIARGMQRGKEVKCWTETPNKNCLWS